MVRVLLRDYPKVIKRFAQVMTIDVSRKILDKYLENVVESMRDKLPIRPVLPPEEVMHFSDSLYYRIDKTENGYVGYVGSNYPGESGRQSALIARAIDEGRRGYSAKPPKLAIRVVTPTGQVFLRKSVGPSEPRNFILPSFWENRGILGKEFVRSCHETYYAAAKEYSF